MSEQSERLLIVRKSTGKSIEEFSDFIGYNSGYYRNLECGSAPINANFAKKLYRKMMVNQDWLLTGKGEMINTYNIKENTKVEGPVISYETRSTNKLLDIIESQQRTIERLIKAGIKELVEITNNMISGKERKTYYKWQLISTHTARRSGCTNMFLAGIEVQVIMSFSGHTTEKSFMKYIKASGLQVAMMAKEHPFFR